MDRQVSPFIIIKNLSKNYGDIYGVKNISMNISNGTYGLIGPNGSGKTTLLKMIMGLIRPTNGEISISGYSPGSPKANSLIGYLSENMGYYEDMSAMEYLRFFSIIYDIPENFIDKRIKKILKQMNIENRKKELISTYSKGMKQRLGIARTMLYKPNIFIFDEPLSGLDPSGRNNVLRSLEIIKEEGKIIIISSHELKELDFLCDNLFILNKGRIIAYGTPRSLISEKNFSHTTLIFNIHTPNDILNDLPKEIPNIINFDYNGESLILDIKYDPALERKILSWLLEKNVDFSQQKHLIDEIYSQFFKGEK